MPQLNPAPWLAILVFSWLIFAIIVPPKVLAHIFPNNPGAMDSKSTKMNAWAWPWQ